MQVRNNHINTFQKSASLNSKSKSNIHFKGDDSKNKINVSNPEYFQANYGIDTKSDVKYQIIEDKNGTLSVQSIVKLSTGDFFSLNIDDETSDKFLKDKNGEINSGLTKKFISLYKAIMEDMVKESNDKLEFYERKMRDNSPALGLDPIQAVLFELENKSSCDEFSRNIVDNIDAKHKRELSKILYEFSSDERMHLSDKALNLTRDLFEISRTKDGYDLSDLNRKKAIINRIDSLSYNFNDSEILPKLLYYTKKEDGSYNISLIEDAIRLMKSFNSVVDVKTTVDILEKYCSKDKKSHDEILNTMIKLQKSEYSIDAYNSEFEDIMNLCFDKNDNFSPLRAKYVLDSTDYINDYIDENMEDFDDYPLYCKEGKNAIEEYFKLSIDNNDEFKPTIDLKDFIRIKLSLINQDVPSNGFLS